MKGNGQTGGGVNIDSFCCRCAVEQGYISLFHYCNLILKAIQNLKVNYSCLVLFQDLSSRWHNKLYLDQMWKFLSAFCRNLLAWNTWSYWWKNIKSAHLSWAIPWFASFFLTRTGGADPYWLYINKRQFYDTNGGKSDNKGEKEKEEELKEIWELFQPLGHKRMNTWSCSMNDQSKERLESFFHPQQVRLLLSENGVISFHPDAPSPKNDDLHVEWDMSSSFEILIC